MRLTLLVFLFLQPMMTSGASASDPAFWEDDFTGFRWHWSRAAMDFEDTRNYCQGFLGYHPPSESDVRSLQPIYTTIPELAAGVPFPANVWLDRTLGSSTFCDSDRDNYLYLCGTLFDFPTNVADEDAVVDPRGALCVSKWR